MKWITHQTAAIGAALVMQLPLEGVIASCVGGVLPDKLDMRIADMTPNRQRTFNRIHRGTTHWFGWWLLLLLLGGATGLLPRIPHLPPFAHAIIMGLGFGGLTHVVLDMLNPHGVPIMPFSRKPTLSLKLCSTGSLGVYVFLGAMLLVFVALLGPELRHTIYSIERAAQHWLRF